jgi:hypothetical protein
MYPGGPEVTVNTGIKLDKLQEVELPMQPLDRVYAVASKSGHPISFIKITKIR